MTPKYKKGFFQDRKGESAAKLVPKWNLNTRRAFADRKGESAATMVPKANLHTARVFAD